MRYGKLEKSARDHYAAGRYDSAVLDCAQSLKLNPNYEKAQRLIQDLFRAAISAHEKEIEKLGPSLAKFKWDDIVRHYESLIRLNEIIASLPTLIDKKTKQVIRFEVKEYAAELAQAKTNAAEAHYQEGLRLSKGQGRDIQKQAAKEFRAAECFYPGYKNAAEMYEKCRRAGIKRMAIFPFEDKSGKQGQYGALSEMITDDIISNVMGNPAATEFLEIVSRTELETVLQEQKLALTGLIDEKTATNIGRILGVHEIMTGQITQIVYAPPAISSRREEQKGTISVEVSKGKYENREVYATVTFNKEVTKAIIYGAYKIIDVETAKLSISRAFSGEAEFACEWATYSGDERALNDDAKKLVRKFREPPPVEGEMVNRAAKSLSTSFANTLIEYAR